VRKRSEAMSGRRGRTARSAGVPASEAQMKRGSSPWENRPRAPNVTC